MTMLSRDRHGLRPALKVTSEHTNQRISMRSGNALYSAEAGVGQPGWPRADHSVRYGIDSHEHAVSYVANGGSGRFERTQVS